MNTQPLSIRVEAVLDHDDVPHRQRSSELARRCGIARQTASRILDGHERLRMSTYLKLEAGLQVGVEWLRRGELKSVQSLRGVECHYLAEYPNDPKRAADMTRAFKAVMDFPEKYRDGLMRMCLRLRNNDRKVLRLLEMKSRGQISLGQFYAMM